MSAAPDFLVVDQHISRNPVARAVAKQRVIAAVRDFATLLYLLADGERVHSDLQAAGKVLAVAIRITEEAGQEDTPHARVMRGGMSVLVALAERGARWRCLDAAAIDQALIRALDVYCTASAIQTQRAHLWVDSLDRSRQVITA